MKIAFQSFSLNDNFTLNNNKTSPIKTPVSFKGQGDTVTLSLSAKELRKISEEQLALEAQKKFEAQKAFHPKTAFMYDPNISYYEIEEKIWECEGLVKFDELAKSLPSNLTRNVVRNWVKGGALHMDSISVRRFDAAYVDLEFEPNKQFLDSIKDQLPTSVMTSSLMKDYRVDDKKLKAWLRGGDIKPVGVEYSSELGIPSLLVDMSVPEHKKVLENHLKITPLPSKYFKGNKADGPMEQKMAPVQELSRLGFGDPLTLAKMVQKGTLLGKIESIEVDGVKKYKVFADVSKYIKSEEPLIAIRAKNPDIIEIHNLAKKLKVKLSDLNQQIIDNDLKIIPYFIFKDDANQVFIDLRDEKTQEFVTQAILQRDIEREILLQQKQEEYAQKVQKTKEAKELLNSEQSLKMKIVWNFCPLSRSVCSEEARNDGYVRVIISKLKEGEELTPLEEVKLLSYRKKCRSHEGVAEEFKEAYRMSKVIMRQYKEKGIESISDPNVRKIIEEHYASEKAPI